jgi:uncharacterized membrane protein required for colicin V production
MIENLLFASLVQSLGDLVVIMFVVGLAIYGWQHGLFLATLAGLQVLGSFIAALFLADLVAPLLVQADCPAQHAFAAAFLVVFLGTIVVIRLAVGAVVRDGMVRLADLVDRIGGTLTGALAGYALAGAVLVAWSMAPAPAALELEGSRLMLDAGTPLLRTATRACKDEDLAARLVRSYETGDWEKRRSPVEAAPEAESPDAAPAEPAAGPAVSRQP